MAGTKRMTIEDKEELVANGFKVRVFMPWHWRVSNEEGKSADVWPTKRKWALHRPGGGMGYARVYRDIYEIIKALR